MTIIILSILAIIATILSGQNWSKKAQIRFIIITIIIGIGLLSIPYAQLISNTIGTFFSTLFNEIIAFLGGFKIKSISGFWKEVLIFIAMITGMVAANMQKIIATRKEFRMTDLIKPMVVSPIVYLPFFSLFGNSSGSIITLLVLSFQNGFFWTMILDRLDKVQETNKTDKK